ncbi:unnamed protein product [Prunus armeniaca]
MTSFLIASSFAKRRPMSNVSYSASLFEAGKPSVTACSNKVSSGVMMMTPTQWRSRLLLNFPSFC